jgi:hypothetical protein
MTSPHTVTGDIGQGAVLESHITPAALQRTADVAPPATCDEERPPEPPHSPEVMEAYAKAKQAGEANDMRSRRIVRQHLTLTEIGDRVGASRTAVRMNLKAMGIDTHRQKRQSPSL